MTQLLNQNDFSGNPSFYAVVRVTINMHTTDYPVNIQFIKDFLLLFSACVCATHNPTISICLSCMDLELFL
jgi:hypothetical protein